MAIEIALNTPLADALNNAIRPKLIEVGWATDGNDNAPLSEYIILMLINGKTQDEIANDIAGDLLNLGPDDPVAKDFAQWLFDQVDFINAQINGTVVDSVGQAQLQAEAISVDQDMEMSSAPADATELNAPTGPKSMRNGSDIQIRGGARGKRMLGQMNRAMDRTHESVLHRVRGGSGNERINAHNRAPPTGPRGGGGAAAGGRMGNRVMNNNRANNIAHGMAAQMQGMPSLGLPGMNMNDANWAMQANAPQGGDIFSLIQQQNQMMAALHQQLAENQKLTQNARGRGRSLFERTERGRGFRRGGHQGNGHHQRHQDDSSSNGVDGEDTEMKAQDPETTICKFNLACTNKDCKFAHQSSAAAPGITIDVNDVCTYGAACKNFKCVGRHPSPATKRAHQSEQECKFFPNCTNPKCPFKHPESQMPLCRNGADCKTEGCKFTHLQTMCRFNPCTNKFCQYKHEDGQQRGAFHDKVWERKFVDADEPEELIITVSENATMDGGVA
ncbi:hypothetical protein BJ170DRAFT_604411 [Xylariales sp. AK1849]|nr:hypothetical protein BJ170DRAFT_604411 [Xylariales sp. AK1849]